MISSRCAVFVVAALASYCWKSCSCSWTEESSDAARSLSLGKSSHVKLGTRDASASSIWFTQALNEHVRQTTSKGNNDTTGVTSKTPGAFTPTTRSSDRPLFESPHNNNGRNKGLGSKSNKKSLRDAKRDELKAKKGAKQATKAARRAGRRNQQDRGGGYNGGKKLNYNNIPKRNHDSTLEGGNEHLRGQTMWTDEGKKEQKLPNSWERRNNASSAEGDEGSSFAAAGLSAFSSPTKASPRRLSALVGLLQMKINDLEHLRNKILVKKGRPIPPSATTGGAYSVHHPMSMLSMSDAHHQLAATHPNMSKTPSMSAGITTVSSNGEASYVSTGFTTVYPHLYNSLSSIPNAVAAAPHWLASRVTDTLSPFNYGATGGIYSRPSHCGHDLWISGNCA